MVGPVGKQAKDCKFPDIELILLPNENVIEGQRLPQLDQSVICASKQITVNYIKKLILRKISKKIEELPKDKPDYVLYSKSIDSTII